MIRSRNRSARALAAWLLLVLSAAGLQAQAVPPSPQEVLGYALGEHFTDHHALRRYSSALAAASPLVEYRAYGTTPERRELFQLVIARPEVRERLDEILAANAELTRAGTTEGRAREIAARNPAVVYFSYGAHGNEASSPEAAMWTAWDLARGAPELMGVLDSLVVVIDPVVNPDGRERYVQWYRSVVGERPNADPQTREHREPWPGGRYNHYLFDLNRDWAWATQPETRARLATWWRWNPQVHVDFHEMSPQSTYFFFPAAAPINPIYPEHVLEWGRRFGEGNARAFDARGWAYFTGESYDLFYPGYGDSWPSLHGTIGMTYEQAGGGSAGLAFRRQAGDTLTLLDRATHHRVAGQATLRTAAAGKTRLILDFALSHRTAGSEHPDVLLVPGRDGRLAALAEHLRAQGIEVERAARPFRAAATAYPGYERRREFPAGTHRVRMRQPRGRLAATLLQPETELRAEYSYDISAWSLPYAYAVEAHQTQGAPEAGWEPVGTDAESPARVEPAAYGYLAAPGDRAFRPLVSFLAQGGVVRVLNEPATLGGRAWPAGTWFLPVLGNDSLRARVAAAGLGSLVVPVASGRSEQGIDLGSSAAVRVRLPRVALVGGEGVAATSYGAHWFFLEQRLGLRFDALLAQELERLNLADYEVIVLPDASGRALSEAALEALRAWVERGGRLVAVAGGAAAAAPVAGVDLREAAQPDSGGNALSRLLATREQRELSEWKEEVPGAILPVRLDAGHPLAWGAAADGTDDRLFVLHEGTRVFEPAEQAEAVASFGNELEVTSGVISPRNLERLEQGAWLMRREVGRGSVVLFADDPLFRLFWKATHPLYVNALLLGAL